MQWAYEEHQVTRFVVSIRPDNIPSRRLAGQLGFTRIGSHVDEEDGLEDIYEVHYGNYIVCVAEFAWLYTPGVSLF